MSDETRWDRDPPRDEGLARLLRAAETAAPPEAVNWDRLSNEVMRRARRAAMGGDWWEFVARWGKGAVAASVAAMLVSGFMLWRATSATPLPEAVAVVPESIAIARVATAYPVETTFASLVQAEHHDEFTAWSVR